jgi:signal transduction histidine kinase
VLQQLSSQLEARVETQTAQLLDQEREAATLEERARLAREIHDTLAQGLTGIVVQLGAAQRALAAESAAADQHIDLAQQMARESLAEARRSVWNLRAPALERGDLGDALRGLSSRPIRPETTASFEQRGDPWPLPPPIESALLRVGQEALVNVAKHAGATQVRLTLEYTPDVVRLSISDDGVGFEELPAGVAAPGPWGGFGLLGMRERITALGGTLDLSSDGGAQVVAVVPRESI